MLEDEARLIRQAQKGKAESFGLLYDHYCPQIYRFVLLKVSHQQEAEDLTHEVFLSAWQKIGNFDQRGLPFSSWLYQIARNRVIDYYRTKKETLAIDDVNESRFRLAATLESDFDQKTQLEQVKKALSQLSDEQQNVILMRFVEDMTPAEIAAALGKSEGAVRLTQYRAIRKLKEIFYE